MEAGAVIRSAIVTLLLVLLLLALGHLYEDVLGLPGLPAAVSLGFILVASHTFSRLFVPLRLPRICAYMVMGMLCGPFVLGLISRQSVEDLRLIERAAIALIALTAGGEIRWALIRQRYGTLLVLMASIAVVVLVGTTAGFLALLPMVGFLEGAPGPAIIAAAVLMGVTAVAKSPSTAVAVIKETRARGTLTETILAVLLLLDVTAVILFAFALGFAEQLTGHVDTFRLADLLALLWEIVGALPVGAAIGLLVSLYFRFVRGNYLLFVFLLCLLLVETADAWGIEPIMMAVMVGFTVENLSDQGEDLMRAIDRSHLPVYVAFFTLAGASVDFRFLGLNWGSTLALIVLIGGLTWVGTELGGWLRRFEKPHRHYLFMGLIAQAGLNLSFATVIRDRLPPPLGEGLYTLILARVAVKQLLGPILFRFALDRVGEIGAAAKPET